MLRGFLFLFSCLRVWAEADPLLAAIQNADLPLVKSLARDSAGLNDIRDIRDPSPRETTLLCEAVQLGSVEIVEVLLDAGATAGAPCGDPNGYPRPSWRDLSVAASLSPLGVAVRNGNPAIAGVLMRRGAPVTAGHLLLARDPDMLRLLRENAPAEELGIYFRERAREPIAAADEAALRAVLQDPGVALAFRSMSATDPNLLLAYTYGAPSLRALLAHAGPPQLAQAEATLLGSLLDKGFGIEQADSGAAASGIPRDRSVFRRWLSFPVATSFLSDAGSPLRHAEPAAFDGDLATSWVEGVEGPGIGQTVGMVVPEATAAISLLPGYGDEKLFAVNNRVRRARLTVYSLGASPSAWTLSGGFAFSTRFLGSADITLEDARTPQRFLLPARRSAADRWRPWTLVVVEILDVYPGSQCDDTCFSEIEASDAAGARLEIPIGPLPWPPPG